MVFEFLKGSPAAVLFRAGIAVALIAVLDWQVEVNIPLGFLYLFPMLLIGSAFRPAQIASAAAVCMFLTEFFDSFAWTWRTGIPRDILIFSAFFGMGLFVYESIRNRQSSARHLQEIEAEIAARRDAEEQLKVLVESSPAAIFTTNSEGHVLLANDAAHRLFALPAGTLAGRAIRDFLPALVNVPSLERNRFRTVMQCRGRREGGEVFLADIWFSTYRTSAGPRLAAMVADTSEDLRNHEESSLHQLLAGSRIVAGAVSHEIRNVCGAIAVVHRNLSRDGALTQNKDFEALGTLIIALERIAAMDLKHSNHSAAVTDLSSLLDEFRIVVEQSLREDDIEVRWEIGPGLPHVWADRQSLMQVFLNLTKNSQRAMLRQPLRRLTISAMSTKQGVTVQFADTGTGVLNPERLFRPFQQGAQATGLGLYLSRAFMRSFRGDVRYEPGPIGSCFVVELSPAPSGEELHGAENPDSSSGRSRLVSGEPQPVAPSRA